MEQLKLIFSLIRQIKLIKNYYIIIALSIFGGFLELISIGSLLPLFNIFLQKENFLEIVYLKKFIEVFNITSYEYLVVILLIIYLSFFLLKTFYLLFLNYLKSDFIAKQSAGLSQKLFYTYLNQPYIFFVERNTAQLVRNITFEVSEISKSINSTIELITEGCVVLFISIFLILNVSDVFYIILIYLMIFFVFSFLKKRFVNWGSERQKNQGELIKHLYQGLGSIKQLKIYDKVNEFVSLYNKSNIRALRANMKHTFFLTVPRVMLEFFAVFTFIILMIFSFIFREVDIVQIFPVLALLGASAFKILPSINRILGQIQVLNFSKISYSKVYDEFKLSENFENEKNKVKPKNKLTFNNIKVQNLSFTYPNSSKEILRDINIQINKGEIVGLIGTTGSGKSTLLNLFCGLITPTKGKILVDEIDIFKNMHEWRSNLTLIPQNGFILDDTIKNNITFGEVNLNVEKFDKVIKVSQLKEFIDGLHLKENTIVGEKGTKLSGGQIQRIEIARALYKDAEIIILDEATSALDEKTEKIFLGLFFKILINKTIIIVSHRSSTLKECNKIYNLENGKIEIKK